MVRGSSPCGPTNTGARLLAWPFFLIWASMGSEPLEAGSDPGFPTPTAPITFYKAVEVVGAVPSRRRFSL